jgi:hypothetical protein
MLDIVELVLEDGRTVAELTLKRASDFIRGVADIHLWGISDRKAGERRKDLTANILGRRSSDSDRLRVCDWP